MYKRQAYARALLGALTERGIFVRMPGVAPLDRCIRVSLGDEPALAAFEAALPEAVSYTHLDVYKRQGGRKAPLFIPKNPA